MALVASKSLCATVVPVHHSLERWRAPQVALFAGQEDPLLAGGAFAIAAADGLVLDDVAQRLADEASAT